MIRINDKVINRFNRKLQKIGQQLIKEGVDIKNKFTPILTHAGTTIRNEIILSMRNTPRMATTQTRQSLGTNKRTVRPSVPGFPPAVDLGGLIGGVVFDVKPLSVEVGVISTGLGTTTKGGFTSYAEILELSKNPKMQRPFLKPAIEKHEDAIIDNAMIVMSRYIVKAVGKGAR
jgi:hypothetical protein